MYVFHYLEILGLSKTEWVQSKLSCTSRMIFFVAYKCILMINDKDLQVGLKDVCALLV